MAETTSLDDFQRARLSLLRGQIAFASSRGNDAPPLLLTAARQLEPFDARLAPATYLEALSAAVFAGRLALGGGLREVAKAAHATLPSPAPARVPDLLLDGLSVLIIQGYTAGAPLLKRAVAAFRGSEVPTEEELRWLWLACHAAGLTWDYESWDVLSARLIRVCHEAGALTALPIAYNTRAGVHLYGGNFSHAGRDRHGGRVDHRRDGEQHRALRGRCACRHAGPGCRGRRADRGRYRRRTAPG